MPAVRPQKRLGQGRNTLFHGKYRGEILDNNDPTGNGRLKVKVHGLTDAAQVTELPWAEPCYPLPDYQFVPENNTKVWVEFLQGDIKFPIVVGFFHRSVSGTSQVKTFLGTSGVTYPKVKGFETSSGHKVTINDTDNKQKVEVETQGGNKLTLDDTQNANKVVLEAAGGNKLTLYETQNAVKVTLESISGHKLTMDDATAAPKVTLEDSSGAKFELDASPAAPKATLQNSAGTVKLEMNLLTGVIDLSSTMPGSSVNIGAIAGGITLDGLTGTGAGALFGCVLQGMFCPIAGTHTQGSTTVKASI